ncbi:hypothetical protein WA026_021873 [Henosepilachna vigintioctopunctata]|uniref:Uncharacterized protein n=1 Tax=Henosepilachna vigintioctopunctata TaxID=420089 RepID=A0AAW1URT5_9CUCU
MEDRKWGVWWEEECDKKDNIEYEGDECSESGTINEAEFENADISEKWPEGAMVSRFFQRSTGIRKMADLRSEVCDCSFSDHRAQQFLGNNEVGVNDAFGHFHSVLDKLYEDTFPEKVIDDSNVTVGVHAGWYTE